MTFTFGSERIQHVGFNLLVLVIFPIFWCATFIGAVALASRAPHSVFSGIGALGVLAFIASMICFAQVQSLGGVFGSLILGPFVAPVMFAQVFGKVPLLTIWCLLAASLATIILRNTIFQHGFCAIFIWRWSTIFGLIFWFVLEITLSLMLNGAAFAEFGGDYKLRRQSAYGMLSAIDGEFKNPHATVWHKQKQYIWSFGRNTWTERR